MGQNMTTVHSIWVLRGHYKTHNPKPEQPIKFQYKKRRKANVKQRCSADIVLLPSKSNTDKPMLIDNRTWCASEPDLPDSAKWKRDKQQKSSSRKCAGHDRQAIEKFLAKASLEQPANIPVVLSFASVLYQTRTGGYQAELAIPLGMVVNAVFRNQRWLYVQTPHGEEGYVAFDDCIPLGIVPRVNAASSPCWETSTDVFPRPSGNRIDTDMLSSSRSEDSTPRCRRPRRHTCSDATATAVERNVDRMYLRVARDHQVRRETLLVVAADYATSSAHTLSVTKGDVVVLLSAHTTGWFEVRRKDGEEGFIPATVVGHGFL